MGYRRGAELHGRAAGGMPAAGIPIQDLIRSGQRGPTELEWDMVAYRRRAEVFGCAATVIDEHDIPQVDAAPAAARQANRPTVVLARP